MTNATIDRSALANHCQAIGWSLDRLETLVDVTDANKATIWALIRPDAMQVRFSVLAARAYFPGATLNAIRPY